MSDTKMSGEGMPTADEVIAFLRSPPPSNGDGRALGLWTDLPVLVKWIDETLRELVLLREVAKHSDMFLKARRFMDRDQQRMSLEELERTLSAYEARPK